MYARNLADALDDLLEMFQVGDVEDDVDVGLSVGRAGFDIPDIRLAVADNCCDLFEHSKTVVAVEGEFYGVGCGRALSVASPLNVNLTVRFIHQRCHVGTGDRVNGYTFSARNVSDNGFTPDRVATPGAIDKQVAMMRKQVRKIRCRAANTMAKKCRVAVASLAKRVA